ncbi:MAG: FtsW/RodA/SpoVE family cell cycle protein [Muribaculaceae bacterium]|nr:FtsW/RodA/SpoVE family cell cycle protein [Muribaculaceae bacterium]
MTPKKAIAAYILAVCVFILGVFSLYHNLEPQLDGVAKAIDQGSTLVLKKGLDQKKLVDILYKGGYIDNQSDADFVASRIKKIVDEKGSIPNLGSLLKQEFKITADTAAIMGGEDFQSRIRSDHYKLGVTDDDNNIIKYREYADAQLPDSASALISVNVKNAKGVNDTIAGIPVRIRQYTVLKDVKGNDSIATDTLGISLTDASGMVSFKVRKRGFYSVLPIKKGFQYGREKGTTKGELTGNMDISFAQRPHVISLLSPQAFSNLKYDRTLVVRTPAEFKDSLISMVAIFILGWGVFLLFIFQLDKKLCTRSDYLLIIALMIISGIGLLTSYGIWNPLTDTLYGSVMTSGLLIGLVAMAAITLVNYAKLDARLSSSKWWILRNYGWTVLAGAFGLLCMLYLFGTGPEGSDAKVNLFGFQPSEISRVLIVIFIAWFFARKATLIQDFSQRLTWLTLKRQLSIISLIILGMMVLMMVYLILSDMGPALVVLVSFILIYSMARRDFAQLLLGLITFIVLMLGTRWLISSPDYRLPSLLLAAAIWFIVWIGYWYWKKKQIYESAIFLNLVIVVFSLAGLILESIGQHGLAARLTNRTDMSWEGVWDNEVLGGDQVVQGIWSLATGGFSGLGLGNGSPAIVPAGHTDMIFTTIGEMLGLVGLALVVLCFFVIIHRTLLIGRRAGYAFPFYLATGLGIVTGIQFLVIVAGSIGLLPLTGVTLPFLSYGRVSFIISLASFGFVVSISRLRANEVQREYTNSFNGSIAACSGLFLLGGVILLCTAAKYQIFSKGDTLIRPAYVTNVEGARVVEYNPRIGLVLRKLKAGNIYDCNGLLLATSNIKELEAAKDCLENAGVTEEMYDKEHSKRKRRYYPFGDHTLFMLGDYNTLKVFGYSLGNPTGYLAESRHLGDLRGIEIRTFPIEKPAKSYKQNRFAAEEKGHKFNLLEHDYSNLLKAGFLNYGIERNPVIKAHNARKEKRDMKLTLDARLQMALQNELADKITNGDLKNNKYVRASVVVLDAKNGDLLCSANYPLPSQDSIFMLNDKRIFGDVPFERIPGHLPITERDLGMTFQSYPGSTAKVMSAMAGFKNMGEAAGKVKYEILAEELVHKENGREPSGTVDMRKAIVESSNCYFIDLVHDKKLYPELDSIYSTVGIRLDPTEALQLNDSTITAYFFYPENEFTDKKSGKYHPLLRQIANGGYNMFNQYFQKERPVRPRSMNFSLTASAWGQGSIKATPLNMARVVSIVANEGKFTPTRYILEEGGKTLKPLKSKEIISPSSAELLKSYMQDQSKKGFPSYNGKMGGKTGTPTRDVRNKHILKSFGLGKPAQINDAWYIFFIDSPKQDGPLAVALRIERSRRNSGIAMSLVRSAVIPTLERLGYIDSSK